MSIAARLNRRRGLASVGPGLVGPELPLVALADWLFWNHAIGLSLPLFCAAVAIVALRFRRGRRGRPRTALATLLLALVLVPAVERLTALSIVFAVGGTALSLRIAIPDGGQSPAQTLGAAARDIVAGPCQMLRELRRRRRLMARRRGAQPDRRRWWLAWIAPLVLTGVFAALLSQANPLIAGWITGLLLPSFDDILQVLPRILFWSGLLAKLWPFVRGRRATTHTPMPSVPAFETRALERLAAVLLSPVAVLRALVLLTILLALQIGLDGAYLWGGLALPDGLTYAAYAHRGAYPLVATALLAGAVALAIRRPGAPPAAAPTVALLLFFLGENVLLVASAMERLDLYVAAYALTQWRAAAFAWMGLVALGLVSIALAEVLGRDGPWLLRVNVAAVLAVIYGWSLIDVPRLVADYDVAHCAELKGEGPTLDVEALVALGPDAIPALDRYLLGLRPDEQRERVEGARGRLARELRDGLDDWRGWSFAGWRLARYLDKSGVAEPAMSPAGDGS